MNGKIMKCPVVMLAAALISVSIAQTHVQAQEDNYEVHEWGVFSIPRGAEWANQEMLREWQSFPEFFHGTLPDRQLVYRGLVTKPVIFFHGVPDKTHVRLLVRFNEGRPLIWWPPAEYPADHGLPNRKMAPELPEQWKGADPDSILRFSLILNETGEIAEVAADHWVSDLRAVDSVPLAVQGSFNNRSPAASLFAESFVYYDGLFKSPAPPEVTRLADGVSIKTNSDHDWLDVIVIERSLDRKEVSMAQINQIEKGERTTEFDLQKIDAADAESFELESLVGQLKKSLEDAGLNKDEAQSLVDVWNPGLFHRPGLTLFYRIKQETYDEWIPLDIVPSPEKLVRVGLVVHHHLEPELEQNVTRLISELGSDEYAVRANAEYQLSSIGGAAFESIKKLTDSTDVETAARARILVKEMDTRELLEKLMDRFDQSENQDSDGKKDKAK